MLKALDLWLPAWVTRPHPSRTAVGVRHVLLCVCDHWEPFHRADRATALQRVARWRRDWPRMVGDFRDAGGVGPRHTFFYPIEQYDREAVHELAELCQETGAETEVHLHHDRDTPEGLRRTLREGRDRLAHEHGLLARDASGAVRYGFIHGNWALDDSHPEGRHCGVRGELAILRETGCYGDFTLPSAPNRTQTRTINSLYYAKSTAAPKSHDTGRPVRSARAPYEPAPDELLIVQGPLALQWRRRKWGLLPRIENSDLTAAHPPTPDRLRLWMECRVGVAERPNWIFVKLHTHGGKPDNADMLLGGPMRAFHRHLAEVAQRDATVRFHYVTAREMVNLLHAAEAGHSGEPGKWRNYRYALQPGAYGI